MGVNKRFIWIDDLRRKVLTKFSDPEVKMIMDCAEKCHPTEVTISKLEFVRRMRGYKQSELSRASGVSTTCIHNLEMGRTTYPHPDTLALLAETLGVSVDDIIE